VDIIPFTVWTQFPLHIFAASGRHSSDEFSEFHQVIGAEQRATCRDRHEWIHRDYVSPAGRKPGQLLMFVVKVNPILTPRVLVRNQFELAAVPGVERVGDPKSSVRTVALRCSCRRRRRVVSNGALTRPRIVW
jgi:hypothetical protein